ncbi:hypothetical protein AMS68_002043 [Peltaster fructicola]|uniref:Uncharacterized protein n=1 Tax=Peltaster fructicola TaxID=286661 RepID=A0A6H0XPB5_9PEZI|nr:hypothetical protein AMS68_002043 [Peltaster fructicola]
MDVSSPEHRAMNDDIDIDLDDYPATSTNAQADEDMLDDDDGDQQAAVTDDLMLDEDDDTSNARPFVTYADEDLIDYSDEEIVLPAPAQPSALSDSVQAPVATQSIIEAASPPVADTAAQPVITDDADDSTLVEEVTNTAVSEQTATADYIDTRKDGLDEDVDHAAVDGQGDTNRTDAVQEHYEEEDKQAEDDDDHEAGESYELENDEDAEPLLGFVEHEESQEHDETAPSDESEDHAKDNIQAVAIHADEDHTEQPKPATEKSAVHPELEALLKTSTSEIRPQPLKTALSSLAQPDAPGTPTDTGLQQVILNYNNKSYPVFKSTACPDSLLKDDNLVSVSLADFIKACRQSLTIKAAGKIGEGVEVVLTFEKLHIAVIEDSPASFQTSLKDVLDVYVQLHENDGIEAPMVPPLEITCRLQVKFNTSIVLYQQAAAIGNGISDFITQAIHDDTNDIQHDDLNGNANEDATYYAEGAEDAEEHPYDEAFQEYDEETAYDEEEVHEDEVEDSQAVDHDNTYYTHEHDEAYVEQTGEQDHEYADGELHAYDHDSEGNDADVQEDAEPVLISTANTEQASRSRTMTPHPAHDDLEDINSSSTAKQTAITGLAAETVKETQRTVNDTRADENDIPAKAGITPDDGTTSSATAADAVDDDFELGLGGSLDDPLPATSTAASTAAVATPNKRARDADEENVDIPDKKRRRSPV